MAKPGPKPLPPEQKRGKRYSVFATEAEADKFERRAKRAGYASVADWLRAIAQKDLENPDAGIDL